MPSSVVFWDLSGYFRVTSAYLAKTWKSQGILKWMRKSQGKLKKGSMEA